MQPIVADLPDRLLERAKRTKHGWKRRDLDALYTGFGFEIEDREKHRYYVHPLYPFLIGSAPKGRDITAGFVADAVRIVGKLIALKDQKGGQS